MKAEPLGPPKGVDERALRELSAQRDEPDWLLTERLRILRSLPQLSPPSWWDSEVDGPISYINVSTGPPRQWGTETLRHIENASPADTPGLIAQEEAELIFRRQLEALHGDGVVFCDLGTALAEHPDLVRPHLGRLVRGDEDQLGALTAALWSGGTFLHVPPGREIDLPLQSSARVRSESPDQFERTLIVAGAGAKVHYIEGCASPVYSVDRTRGAAVEIVVGPSAQVSYTTVQNWSANVAETTRTVAEVAADGRLMWTAGNIGARRSVRRLTCRLTGSGASGVAQTISYAGAQQLQQTDLEMVHASAGTHSELISRSVGDRSGRVEHQDQVAVEGVVTGSTAAVRGNGIQLAADASVVHTFSGPEVSADGQSIPVTRVGSTSALDEDEVFYLMTRGLSRPQAIALLVNGFIDPVISTLPTEYAVEWNRLIELQLGEAIG